MEIIWTHRNMTWRTRVQVLTIFFITPNFDDNGDEMNYLVPNPKRPYRIQTTEDTGSFLGTERQLETRYLATQHSKIQMSKDSSNKTNMMSCAMVYSLVLNNHFGWIKDCSPKHAKTMALKLVTRRIDVMCPSLRPVSSSLFPAVKMSNIVLGIILNNPSLYNCRYILIYCIGIKFINKALHLDATIFFFHCDVITSAQWSFSIATACLYIQCKFRNIYLHIKYIKRLFHFCRYPHEDLKRHS